MPFTKRTRQDLPLEEMHGLSIRSLFRPEEADQLSMRWIQVGPGRVVPPSRHLVAREVLYVLDGEAEFTVGGVTETCRAGDFLNVAPGTVHSMRTRDSAVTFLAVQSPPVENDRDFYWVDDPAEDP
jgi:quercetin dioxygenase-like cupin family protein